MKTYIVGTYQNCFCKAIPIGTHNICFMEKWDKNYEESIWSMATNTKSYFHGENKIKKQKKNKENNIKMLPTDLN